MKRKCSMAILICAFIFVIVGIIVLFFPENHCGPSGSGVSRASTEIKFGADYYTTAAQYSGLNANTAIDIYKLLKICFGILFIFMGLITFFLNLPSVFEANNSSLKNQLNVNEILITNTPTENAEKNENEIEREN